MAGSECLDAPGQLAFASHSNSTGEMISPVIFMVPVMLPMKPGLSAALAFASPAGFSIYIHHVMEVNMYRGNGR
jgi:hypothetical protein